MKCDHCDLEFKDDMDGLATMTFHLIMKHGEIING